MKELRSSPTQEPERASSYWLYERACRETREFRLSLFFWPVLFALIAVMALLFIFMQLAHAGGPKYVAGTTYFNPGTAGVPLTWAQAAVTYYTDQGPLSSILPGSSADAFVADAFSQWTSIATVALTASRGGQLGEDVSGANVFLNTDGSISMPADIMPTAVATPVGIVYDADGSVTEALKGQGSGGSDQCFSNAVYGDVDNFGTDAHFLHALVVINGNCAQTSAQLPDVEYRLVRVLGEVLGLGWSQTNDNVLTDVPPPTPDDYVGFSIMHASDPTNCVPITICYATPYTPEDG